MADTLTAKKSKLTREFGKDFLETLSHNAAASPLHAVEELVANSWDADATIVKINYWPGKLSIEDNGSGMSPEGIGDFYRVGDSKKVGKTSPGGRAYFGSFGLATLSIRLLAGKYTLETTKDEEKTVVTERFPKRLSLEDVIEPETFKAKGESSGTKLHLEELKVSERNGFTIDKLMNHLAWSMPVDDPEFVLTINGRKIVPKAIESAHTFDFNFVGRLIGPAKGKIYLTKHPNKDAGVYITVNKRRIGNPKEIVNLNELNDSTARRIIARISVDGLSDYIKANREGFRPSDAFDEFRAALVTQLKDVFRFSENNSQTKKAVGLVKGRENFVRDTVSKLKKAQIEEAVGGARIKFTGDLPSHVPAKFEPKDNTIYLNQSYPTTSTESGSNSAIFRHGMMISAVEALAEHRATLGRGTREEFEKHKLVLLNSLKTSSSGKQAQVTIFQGLHYSPAAIAEISKRSLTTIRYLADNKALTVEGDEIIGRSYIEVANETIGLIPLPDFLTNLMAKRVLAPGSNLYQQLGRFKEIFDLMGDNAQPFVRRFKDSTAYFVESSCEEGITKQLKEIDLRSQKREEVKKLFTKYGSRQLTQKELEGEVKLNGYSVPRVENYAQGQGLKLRKESSAVPRYNLGDFVSVVQHLRQSERSLVQKVE